MVTAKAKIYKNYNLLIRLFIIAVTYVFIYRQVFRHHQLDDIATGFREALNSGRNSLWTIILLMLMMLLNWGLEAGKWRLLIGKIEKVSFADSFKAVLTGISVSMFTPNRTGDYLGRVFILEKANRIEGVLITIVGSFSQIVVTVFAGLAGLLYFMVGGLIGSGLLDILFNSLAVLIPIAALLLLATYFKITTLSGMLRRLFTGRLEKYAGYIEALANFTGSELLKVLLLSLARFLVFSTQFFLLLLFFGLPIPFFDGLMLTSLVYLVMLVVPSIALVEVGIRGSISVWLIGIYLIGHGYQEPSSLAIFSASTLLWFINLVVPAILGTFFVYRLKFFRR